MVFILVSLLVAVVGYAIYWFMSITVPEGFKDPWMFRKIMARLRITNYINELKEYVMDPKDIIISMRDNGASVTLPKDVKVQAEDRTINGVTVRVFVPEKLTDKSSNPGVIYYHGGGWVKGNIRKYDALCSLIAYESEAIVLYVEYRLAPEHPYPAAMDDCYAATTYFLSNSEEFNVDPERIALLGDSAGGNLAAVMSLRLRDSKFQRQPKLQVLIYPSVQKVDYETPSFQANKYDSLLPRRKNALYCSLYATGQAKYTKAIAQNRHTSPQMKARIAQKFQHNFITKTYSTKDYEKPNLNKGDENVWNELKRVLTDPYFSPLMTSDFSNLPDTIIFTVEHDVIRDDGIFYAKFLSDAGNNVEHQHYKSGFHGMFSMLHKQTNFIEFRRMIIKAMKTKL